MSLGLATLTKRTSSSGYTDSMGLSLAPACQRPASAPMSASMCGTQRTVKVGSLRAVSAYLKGAFDLIATLVSKED